MWDTTDELLLQARIASLSGKPFVRARKTWKLPVTRTFFISNDCSTFGDISCVVWSCMRDPTGELRPRQTSVVLWYNIVSACTASRYVYIAIWCATTHDNETHLPYDCMLHTKRRLNYHATMHRFVRTKLASYTNVAVSFQLFVYANTV